MAIANFDALMVQIQLMAHRTDLASVVEGLYLRAESNLNRELRLTQQERKTVVTLPAGERFVDYPAGFLDYITLHVNIDGGLRQLRPFPSKFIDNAHTTNTGEPNYFRVMGEQFEFDVIADVNYDIHCHWYRAWNLEADGTNWLLQYYPDLLIDAAMIEVGLYTRDAEVAQASKALLDEKIAKMKMADARVRNNVLLATNESCQGHAFNINEG